MKYNGMNREAEKRAHADNGTLHIDRLTMSPEEFAAAYHDLVNNVKVCSCGRVHSKVRRTEAQENEMGLWFNCACHSTLFIKKGGY